MEEVYDLLVVGAGIAGCETAWRAAGQGARVLLISMSLDQINLPAHLPALFLQHTEAEKLKERLEGTLFGESFILSSLGSYQVPFSGEVAMVFDRREFSLASKEMLEKKRGLDMRQALIKSLRIDQTVYVESIFGEAFKGKKAVFAPGCYVKGRIRTGRLKLKSGRYGDLSAEGLAESLHRTGVKTTGWSGTVPEVVDMRRLTEKGWKEAEPSSHFPSEPGGRSKKPATGRPLLWKEDGGSSRLLVQLSPRSDEAFLVLRPSGVETGVETTRNMQRKEVVRMRVEQECLVIEERGVELPPTVDFAGSFNGARGYLDCMESGMVKADEMLRK